MTYGLAVAGVILADRFLLKRNDVSIENVSKLTDSKWIRFSIDYTVKRTWLRDVARYLFNLVGCKTDSFNGTIHYSLRNKKRPTAVVMQSRSLAFSRQGLNSEFLTFDKADLEREAGESVSDQLWVLDVKIVMNGSRINPLYKIFEMESCYSGEFQID